MANIRKSFNFRNGVQVDNDRFVVSPTGRVGIGTSSPSVYLLNVFGDTRTTGLTTTRDLYVTQNVEVGGITTVGFLTASEVSVSSTVTAASFVGDGGGLTGVIASGTGVVIQDDGSSVGTGGTINFGSNISVSPVSVGVVTVSVTNVTGNVNGNLTGDVTGNVTGDLTGDVTGNVAGNLTGNVNALSGISTFVEVKIGTAITMSAGIVTATTFEGNTNATKLATGTIPDARFPATLPTASGANLTNLNGSNISSGTIAAARVETLNQNTTGTAANLSGTPNVILGVTTTGNLSSQTITGTSIAGIGLSVTSIGIGTASPANTFQQRETGATELQVTSDTASASVTIGREPGVNNTNNAEFRYGHDTSGFPFSNEQSLDIINYGTGNFNYYLSANNAGASVGSYIWHKGSNNSQLMSLTKDGDLGIGITNPTHKLNVQGISTFTDTAYFNGDVTIDGSLSASFQGNLLNSSSDVIVNVSERLLNGNVNITSGISTFNKVSAGSTVHTPNLIVGGNLVSVDSVSHIVTVNASQQRFYVDENGALGISTTLSFGSDIGINALDKFAVLGGVSVGSTIPKCAVDFADAGTVGIGTTQPYFLPPKLTTSTRNGIGGTVTGATIYNTNLNKLQVYTGSAWETLTSS